MKKCIAQTGNKTGVLQQKHLVQLDWAPTEDGSHVLTVAVGSKILFFSPVSNDLAVGPDLVNNGITVHLMNPFAFSDSILVYI